MEDATRWATFDCYGTLVDWNGGIRGELARLFGEDEAPRLLDRYHELEPLVQEEDPRRAYREVLTVTLTRVADEAGIELPAPEQAALARSLPEWRPFPDVKPALERLRASGWSLAILSNTDRDLVEASMRRLEVPFEQAIVAGEIGSYKPGHRHWKEFFAQTGVTPERHVHVAASLFHDIAPANELGLRSVWVNRLGERPGPEPTRELPDLNRLPDTLEELVPA